MKDLYKVLGVDNEASLDEIKKAYFELAKKSHPDSGEDAETKLFYEVSEAYQILSNKEERDAYDQTISGGKVMSDLVDEVVHPKFHKGDDSDIDLTRQREMHQFRKDVLWKAVFRVFGFSVVVAGAGYLVSLVLSGVGYVGAISGFGFGIVWSVNRNFNVNSFFKDGKKRFEFKIFEYFLLIFPLAYFVYLLIQELF